MNSLAIERVVKLFGARCLLDIGAVNFTAGSLHLIQGDNGVGKTTFLKMLAGLDKPALNDKLDFSCDGIAYPRGDYPDNLRRAIVYVHQHPYLFSTSVAANIGYGLKLRKMPRGERDLAVQAAIRWAGLEAVATVAPKRLSGGEKQRVALARALVLKAPVMLIDEPTANLDAGARDQVKTLLESLRAEGRIVVIATHDPALMGLAETSKWRLQDGKLLAAG